MTTIVQTVASSSAKSRLCIRFKITAAVNTKQARTNRDSGQGNGAVKQAAALNYRNENQTRSSKYINGEGEA